MWIGGVPTSSAWLGPVMVTVSAGVPPTTTITYEIRAVDSSTNLLVSGLHPSFLFFVDTAGNSLTPPLISELDGLGVYHFSNSSTDASFRIDLGSAMSAADRYVDGVCSTTDAGGGATVEQIDAQLSGAHGAGSWVGVPATIALPVMQGSIYTATAAQQRTVTIVQGDTPTITFDFGADYTGYAARFGAKIAASDSAYAIAPKICTWIDAAKGRGSVTLSAADTAAAGKYLAEIEISNGSTILTALKCTLIINPDIIKAV